MSRALRFKLGGAFRAYAILLCLAVVAAVIISTKGDGKSRSLTPTVADVQPVHVGVTLAGRPVRQIDRVPQGATVQTEPDGRARLRLDDGTAMVVGGSTSLVVEPDGVRIQSGRIFVQGAPGAKTRVNLGGAVAIVTGAHAAITRPDSTSTAAKVYVASGELTVRARDRDHAVRTGESAVINGDQVTVTPERVFDDWTGGLAVPWGATGKPTRAVSELWGRTTPGDAGSPLTIRAQDVAVRIVGETAETNVKATFFHAGSVVVQGDFRLALPPGAIVSGFAAGKGDTVQAAHLAMAVRDAAASKAPGPMLEWAGEQWVRGTIPAISPGTVVTVAVTYVEWLHPQPVADGRGVVLQYRYPLVAETPSPLIGEFSVRVNVDASKARAISAGLGAAISGNEISLRKADFRPAADFVVELDAQAWSAPARMYVASAGDNDDNDTYVLVRAQAPAGMAHDGVSLVVVLDTSASIDPGMLDTERAFVEALVSALGPRDRLVVLSADETAHAVGPGSLGPVDPERRKAILDGLAALQVAGATDLGRVIEQAADVIGREVTDGMIVTVGDGWPTVGDLHADQIRARLARRSEPSPRLGAVAVGPVSNRFGLAALVRGSGPLLEIADRADAAAKAATLMADALRPSVADVEIAFDTEVERVYPLHARTVPAGDTVFAVGRLRASVPKEVTLRWRDAQGNRQERLRVSRETAVSEPDVRRRWAAARVEELVLHSGGREAAVDVALRADLLTPWTGWVVGSGGYGPTLLDARVLDLSVVTESIYAASLATVSTPTATLLEDTAEAESGSGEQGDEAVRAAVRNAAKRVLEDALDSVRACRDSRAAMRADLAGALSISFKVDGEGHALDVRVSGAPTARDDALLACVGTVVGGLSFPATGIKVKIEVAHQIELPPGRPIQVAKCSATSQLAVALRRGVWLERMKDPSNAAMAQLYLQAKRGCELATWTERRALLELMLSRLEGVNRIAVARQIELAGEVDAAAFLKQEVVRRARTPEELRAVRRELLHWEGYPFKTFEKEYLASGDNAQRLAVVRKFLSLAPHDSRLRHQLLDLLEAQGEKEALRQQIALFRRDPFVDAGLLADCAAALRRLGDDHEARRTFGEIVERAPGDPWARAFAGDRLRNEGWYDDAMHIYAPLEQQMASDQSVLLRTAMAHEGAGRIDLAARVLARLTQTGGRSERSDLRDLASSLASIMFAQPRPDISLEQREELSRRALELPAPTQGTVILVRAPAARSPIDAKLVRGPAKARQEKGPDVWAHGLGLYRFVLEQGDSSDVVLKLTPKKELHPVLPVKVRLDAVLARGAGRPSDLVTKELEIEPLGNVTEIRWSGEKWL